MKVTSYRSGHQTRLLILFLMALLTRSYLPLLAGAGDPKLVAVPSDTLVRLDLSSYESYFSFSRPQTVVYIDPSKEQGDLLSDMPDLNGRYRYYEHMLNNGRQMWFLKVTCYGMSNAYYFFSERKNNAFTYFGQSEAAIDKELDTRHPWVEKLAQFLLTPIDLNSLSLATVVNITQSPDYFNDQTFRNSFTIFSMRHLLDSMADHPDQALPSRFAFNASRSFQSSKLSEMDQFVEAIKERWNQLTIKQKAFALSFVNQGGSRRRNKAAILIIKLLGELNRAPAPQNFYESQWEASFLNDFVWSFSKSPNLDDNLRAAMIHLGMRRAIDHLPDWALSLAAQLDEFPEPGLAKENWHLFEKELEPIIREFKFLTSGIPNTIEVLTDLRSKFSSSQISSVHGFFQDVIPKAESPQHELGSIDHIVEYLQNLGNSYHWSLFGNWLLRVSSETQDLRTLDTWLSTIDWKTLKNLPTGVVDTVLHRLSDVAVKRFSERGQDESSQSHFDGFASHLIHLANTSSKQDFHRSLLLPLLTLYNPQAPDEPKDSYAKRTQLLAGIFVNDGIFICDLNGMLVRRPELFNVFREFAKYHPGWVDVAVFPQEGIRSGTKQGVVQFDSQAYVSSNSLMSALVTEAAPSFYSSDHSKDKLVKQLSSYWYEESTFGERRMFVPPHAERSPIDYWTGLTGHWHKDAHFWLKVALNLYELGDVSLLNMFLIIWELPAPADTPNDARSLFLLGDDGTFNRDFIPAKWESGSFEDGTFLFAFDDAAYKVVWKNNKISALTKNGRTIPEEMTEPVVDVPFPNLLFTWDRMTWSTNLFTYLHSKVDGAVSMLSGPSGAIFDSVTGDLSWKPLPDQSGYQVMLFQVNDIADSKPSTYVPILFKIVHNSAPQIRVNDRYVASKTLGLVISNIVTDVDFPMNEIKVSLIEGAHVGAFIDEKSNVFSWFPPGFIPLGEYKFTLAVEDTGWPQERVAKSFTVDLVENVPPPKFQLGNRYETTWGSTLIISNITDGTRPVVFSLINGNGSGARIDPLTGQFRWSPGKLTKGTYNHAIQARDAVNPNLSASKIFSIELKENFGPISLLDEVYFVTPGEELTIANAMIDASEPADKFQFSINGSVPDELSLDSDTGAMNWRFSNSSNVTVAKFLLRASEVYANGDEGSRLEREVAVNLGDTSAWPRMNLKSNYIVDQESVVILTNVITVLTGSVSDFRFTGTMPGWASIDETSGTVTIQPHAYVRPGLHPFKVTAINRMNSEIRNSREFAVTVRKVNHAPTIRMAEKFTVTRGEELRAAYIITDSDLPAETLDIRLVGETHGAFIDSDTKTFRWKPASHQLVGEYRFVLQATDNGLPNLTSTHSFSVTFKVSEYLPPKIQMLYYYSVALGDEISIPNVVFNPNVMQNPISLKLEGETYGALVDSQARTFRWKPNAQTASGKYIFELQATDSISPHLITKHRFAVAVYIKGMIALKPRVEFKKFHFTGLAKVGSLYSVEVSTNLVNWKVIHKGIVENSDFLWSELIKSNVSPRFFRVVIP